MRWLPFLIVGYLIVATQFALTGALGWGVWMPNFVFLFVIFVGMHAPIEPAMLGGLVVGLLHDVIASHGLGTYGLGYAVAAAIAVQLRGIMYSDHIVTHVMMPLLLGGLLLAYLLFRQWLRNLYFPLDGTVSFRGGMASLTVTTLLAVPVIATLRNFKRPFAFER